jgi:hypothetical protein
MVESAIAVSAIPVVVEKAPEAKVDAKPAAVDKPVVEESNESKDSLNYEEKALKLGWAPKDKFKGNPAEWRDAKDFYEKGELVLPLVKKQRDEARAEAAKASKRIADLESGMASFQKLVEEEGSRKVKEQIAALKDVRAAAVASGDDKAFRAADDAIDELKESQVKAKVEEKPVAKVESDPEFDKWKAENPWYDKDQAKKEYADQLGVYLHNVKKMSRAEVLEAVANKIAEMEQETSGTARAGPQRGGQASGANTKTQTFDNMVPEAKKAYDSFIRQGIKMTKEQYVSKVGPEAWGA